MELETMLKTDTDLATADASSPQPDRLWTDRDDARLRPAGDPVADRLAVIRAAIQAADEARLRLAEAQFGASPAPPLDTTSDCARALAAAVDGLTDQLGALRITRPAHLQAFVEVALFWRAAWLHDRRADRAIIALIAAVHDLIATEEKTHD
jgi:hypothetical protein